MRRRVLIAITAVVVTPVLGLAAEDMTAETATPPEEAPRLSAEALPSGSKVAVLEFEKGNVDVHLLLEETPVTAGNFIRLVEDRFYDGLPVHRVEDFVVQAGDATRAGREDPDIELALEPDRRNCVRGIMSMARFAWKDDETHQVVYGATSPTQFFVLKLDAPRLDPDFCVFGVVVSGMDVVDRLEVNDVISRIRVVTVGGKEEAPPETTED